MLQAYARVLLQHFLGRHDRMACVGGWKPLALFTAIAMIACTSAQNIALAPANPPSAAVVSASSAAAPAGAGMCPLTVADTARVDFDAIRTACRELLCTHL